MAHHYTSVLQLPKGGEFIPLERLSSLKFILLLVGSVGAALSVWLLFFGGTLSGPYAYSYLVGFFFFVTFAIGGLFWTLLHNAANASWGVAVRRVWENLAWTMPVFVVLSIPFFFPSVQAHLWEWMAIHREAGTLGAEGGVPAGLKHFHDGALLLSKYRYMNITFWTVRIVAFLALLTFAAYKVRTWPIKQEADGDFKHTFRARGFSCAILFFFAVSTTFLAIDLLMALDFRWYSTMWGVYIFAGCAWASMALTILVVNCLRAQGLMLKVVTDEHYHLMGKLLFAFTVFWAYISFSQFFLIWYANITEEILFYKLRNTAGWHVMSLFLVVGHFGLPFLLLLQVWLKKAPWVMNTVCIWILLMHLVDYYWIVIPERGPSLTRHLGEDIQLMLPHAFWGDILALATVGSFAAYVFLRNLGSRSLYAWRDPRLEESVNVTN